MRSVGLSLLLVVALVVCVCGQPTEVAKADSIAELYPGHSLSDLGLLSYRLTHSLTTDIGKFRSIYKWVCLNIESDFDLMELAKRKRLKLNGSELEEWNRKFHLKIVKTLVSEHKTLCTGYAWLVRELAIRAGIDCEMINGYGRSPRSNIGTGFANHSWNAVRLDGQWYLCDATWSSGAVTTGNTFIHDFKQEYFLSDPEMFVRSHYPLDTKWTLLGHPSSLEYFLDAPLIYVNSYKFDFRPSTSDKFMMVIQRGQSVSFNYSKPVDINSKRMQFIIESRPVLVDFNSDCVEYTFNEKGTFAVHIAIDLQPVVTYEISVK